MMKVTLRISLMTVLTLAVLTGCGTPPDSHIPDFARRPYEAFSRQAAVSIAIREWRAFGEPIAESKPIAESEDVYFPEQVSGLWQRVGEYWWLGLNADKPARARTGKHDERGQVFQPANDSPYAWSAVFVSYVIRMAGAGRAFPYSAAHIDYINAAHRASFGQTPPGRVWAERIEDYAPQLGDLICMGRGPDRALRFDQLPLRRAATHCDLVVGSEAGRLAVIGGNVDDAVALKFVPVTIEGKLGGVDGSLDDRFPWFVVLRVLYER